MRFSKKQVQLMTEKATLRAERAKRRSTWLAILAAFLLGCLVGWAVNQSGLTLILAQ